MAAPPHSTLLPRPPGSHPWLVVRGAKTLLRPDSACGCTTEKLFLARLEIPEPNLAAGAVTFAGDFHTFPAMHISLCITPHGEEGGL